MKWFKCFLRNVRRRPRVMRKMRGFNLNGCKVELYNNHRFSFKFEYKIIPYKPHNFKFAMTYRGRLEKIIHDPSSMKTLKGCRMYAKHATDLYRTRSQYMRS